MTELSIAACAGPGSQSGTGTFEPPPSGSWALFEAFGPWVLVAFVVAVVARAVWRRRRYLAVAVLDDAAQAAVRDAVAAAERRTVGEIVPVVVERSDAHPGACWLTAVTALLLGSTLLEGVLPWGAPGWLLLSQLGLAAIGYGLARLLPDLQRSFVSEGRATAVVEEQAFQEFFREGLHKTAAATGVLIFVSLLERRVVVLGDEGIAAHLPGEFWGEVREAILDGVRRGSLRDGLVEGIRRTGEALAAHAPWLEGDRDEVPNRVVVRRE
jgi:putative membrane protein